MIAASNQLLWSMIGLLLTMGGTFLEAYGITLPWNWSQTGIQTFSLGVSYQVGAVLLVGCLGGKNAGALSQIAYLVMGLTLHPVFSDGGGNIGYVKASQFGYLLGFIPGAWICGFFAFQARPKIESLTFSCICGLLSVHLCGIAYLMIRSFFHWQGTDTIPLMQSILVYSWWVIPGQLAVVCAVSVVAYVLRHLMFY
ncbi:biotin transporter BioY [Anabaena sp. FACHB-709]|jgi:biotin transport system substrate-specific component|uniref:Biotin transporter n=5 Tax=Nostocaceae TaxID=1162 RepID=A0A1Z4KMK2_ANAVA|nr:MULTISPECIES: biotin transporter BioY [Nostocaceae]BAY70189.1 BioY protein [Trichormus variabilis NIES-23]HBW28589.1 biotin transporter BioY [Nostoc sp. UBA8866]ABA22091.1 BioY protein [Trichormus variabilis ATCC 29413]MBC1217327.1 biotin transporter BioY [Trichormus variabilis ARAD]MBC1257030.1 biotin transporter BioY [Trichormus variabilis V5]